MDCEGILQQIEATAAWFEQTSDPWCDQPDSERRPASHRWLAALFALLVFGYYAENSLAEVIRGNAQNEHLSVSWEYDLHYGTGRIYIANLGLMTEEDMGIAVRNMLPYYISDLRTSPALSSPCLPWRHITMCSLQPGTGGYAWFVFCAPPCSAAPVPLCQTIRPVTQPALEYAVVGAQSACTPVPMFPLPGFVSVAPMECPASDTNADGDVDLQDFATFQREIGETDALPCHWGFARDMTGPR